MAQDDRVRSAGTDESPVSPDIPAAVAPLDPPEDSLDQPFDRAALVALRSAVAAHGGSLGLAGERLDLLVVVAHELATNAVRHGGGHGRLRLWRADGRIYCQVSDGGPGLPDLDPGDWNRPPPVFAEGGRGLYFVHSLADAATVRSNGAGAVITVAFAVP